ncbi:unnamed protein product [Prunus armeniaca]
MVVGGFSRSTLAIVSIVSKSTTIMVKAPLWGSVVTMEVAFLTPLRRPFCDLKPYLKKKTVEEYKPHIKNLIK